MGEKLVDVHRVADEAGDPSLTDFIEGEYLEDQVEAIKKVATYVSQLRRIGKGVAPWWGDNKYRVSPEERSQPSTVFPRKNNFVIHESPLFPKKKKKKKKKKS